MANDRILTIDDAVQLGVIQRAADRLQEAAQGDLLLVDPATGAMAWISRAHLVAQGDQAFLRMCGIESAERIV